MWILDLRKRRRAFLVAESIHISYDVRHYGKVADNSYRFNPFPLSNKELAGFHGTNEKIRKKDFLDCIRAYIRIIEKGSST